MATGVNNKAAYPKRRLWFNDVGYSKFSKRPAVEPRILANFLENPTANNHGFTISCSRSTANGTYIDANGVLQTAAANVPRFNYDLSGACLGLLCEPGRTNLVVYSRDFSQANWAKTNTTGAQSQTGIDAAATSASLITATADSGNILQSVTSTSGAHVFTAYVKRVSGTGAVSMTLDGGSTLTAITSSISDNKWTRVRATQTLANPSVGFVFATSGDSIIVDYVQLEKANFETSAILSGGAQGARQPDSMLVTTITPWWSNSAGTIYAEAYSSNGLDTVNQYLLQVDDTTSNERHLLYRTTAGAPTLFCQDGGATQASLTNGSWANVTTTKMTYTYAANDVAGAIDNSSLLTDTSATMPTVTTWSLGVSHANTSHLGGHIRRLLYWDATLQDTMLKDLTA